MIIYQLHQFGGEYEDHFDYIIGSYLNRDKAEESKVKAEKEELERRAQSKLCDNCPIGDLELQHKNFETIKDICKNYCDNANIYKDFHSFDCDNYTSRWDESNFELREVEVEE